MDRWQLRLRRREHWCGWIALRCDLEQVDKAARPYRQISVTRKWMHRQSFQVPKCGVDTTKCGPTTLEGGSQRTARGRRFLRGRTGDDHTRSPYRRFSTVQMMVRRRPWKSMKCRRYNCRTGFPTWVPVCPRGSQCCAPRFLRSQTRCKWQRSGNAH